MVDQLFDMLDTDSNGIITKQEFINGLQAIMKVSAIEHLISELDTNKDGNVSREECKAYLHAQMPHNTK